MTLWQKIQNYFFVTLIAVLVWFYAESENRKDHREPVTISFVSAPGQNLIIAPQQLRSVTAQFKCTTGQYEMFRRIQKQGIELEIRDTPNSTEHSRPIILRDRLNTYAPLAAAGITIRETDPPATQLRVERLVTRAVPVVVPALSGDLLLANPPTVDVPTANLRVPESLVPRIADLRIEARLDAADLATLEENVQRTLTVPLTLPENFWKEFTEVFADELPRSSVTLEQNSAKVTVAIRKPTQSLALPIVPILVTAAPTELSRFTVELEPDQPVLQNITLVGPIEAIERIRKRDKGARVWAQLTLSTDDLEQAADKGVRSAPLELIAPAGVRAEPPLPSARFRVTRLSTLPTAPAPSLGTIPSSPRPQ